VVSKSLVRELSPVLTALVVGGRIGAGMTAEIGTMKVTEQIDGAALDGRRPGQEAGVPKLLATLVMLPALTVLGDVLGILGGLVIAWSSSSSPVGRLHQRRPQLPDPGRRQLRHRQVLLLRLLHRHRRLLQWADRRGRRRRGRPGHHQHRRHRAILVLVSDFFLTKLFYILSMSPVDGSRDRPDPAEPRDADAPLFVIRGLDQVATAQEDPRRPRLRHRARRVPGDPRPLGQRQERDPAPAQRPRAAGRGQRSSSTGVDLGELSERQLFPVRRGIAMLFQGGALFDSMNVFENVAFPLREHTG
jgi:hypothetical protein